MQGGATTSYTYDAADRMTAAGPDTYAYDANGQPQTRTVGTATTRYCWDALGRLVWAADGPATPPPASGYKTAVLADAPGAYWRLGDTCGATATDSSGSGKHGTLLGGVTPGQTGAIGGEADAALRLDGSSGYVAAPTAAAVTGAAARSVEVWFRTTGVATTQQLFSYGSWRATRQSFGLRFNNAATRLLLWTYLSKDPFPGLAERPGTLHPYVYVLNDPANDADPTGLCGAACLGRGGTSGLGVLAALVAPEVVVPVVLIGGLLVGGYEAYQHRAEIVQLVSSAGGP